MDSVVIMTIQLHRGRSLTMGKHKRQKKGSKKIWYRALIKIPEKAEPRKNATIRNKT